MPKTPDQADPPLDQTRPSKSQRKRDMDRLQKLGGRLVELKPGQRGEIDLSDELTAAIDEMDRMKGHEARRRHLQYIGKLMRNEDESAITGALQRLDATGIEQTRLLHESERWRDRLIEEGDDALAEYLRAHSGADHQHLRQLIRGARRERELGKPPGSARKLFRYLRDCRD